MKNLALAAAAILGFVSQVGVPSAGAKTEPGEPENSGGGAEAGDGGKEGEGKPRKQIEIELPKMAEGSPAGSQLSALLFQRGPKDRFHFDFKEPEPKKSPYPDALCYDDFDEYRFAWRRSGSSWSEYGGAFHGRDAKPYTSPPRASSDFSAFDLDASFQFSLGRSGRLNVILYKDDQLGGANSSVTISLSPKRITIYHGGLTTSTRHPDLMRSIVSKRPVKQGKFYRTKKKIFSGAASYPEGWSAAKISFRSEEFTLAIDGEDVYSASDESYSTEKYGITFVPGPATVSIDDFLVEPAANDR